MDMVQLILKYLCILLTLTIWKSPVLNFTLSTTISNNIVNTCTKSSGLLTNIINRTIKIALTFWWKISGLESLQYLSVDKIASDSKGKRFDGRLPMNVETFVFCNQRSNALYGENCPQIKRDICLLIKGVLLIYRYNNVSALYICF